MPEVLDANRMETVVFVELYVTWPVQNGDCGVCGALCDVAGTEWRLWCLWSSV
jgi:hypothetical protein